MEEPIQTQNATLAATLLIQGVPHPLTDKGEVDSCDNIFDMEIIRGFADQDERASGKKSPFRGLTLFEGGNLAWKQGRLGHFGWKFVRNEKQALICRVFDETNKAIKEQDESGDETARSIVTVEADTAEITKICALHNKAKTALFKAAQSVVPYVARAGEFKQETHGNKTTVKGSLQMCKVNASAEFRAKCGF